MILEKLLDGIDYEIVQGIKYQEIDGVDYDSRNIKNGELFVCIKGFSTDGHRYVDLAIEKGAKAIICEDDVECAGDITIIKVKDSRKALAIISSNLYDNPNKKIKIIGITGTNGKTTTAFMMKAILEEEGYKVGLIGTIANYIGNEKIDTERTTPESLELQELFNNMVNKGCQYCVMEVSSHSLALDRVYKVEFEVGIFTNLTRDHLDFHKTFENYYNEKFKLFKKSKINIINIDDKYGTRVFEDVKILGQDNNYTYSIKNDSDYRAYDEVCDIKHIGFKVKLKSTEEKFIVGLPGKFNIYNSLGAIAAAEKLGISLKSIKSGIENVVVVGRCEMVGRKYNLPYTIILDYAHSPDGLDNILQTARGFTSNRLICVFGCGGNRDKEKRPQMGEIASRLSDIAIVTTDNPRSEEPSSIIKDILAGIKKENYQVVKDRREAIKKAITLATSGDVIVIAGKGHEDYQILKTGKIHFDEREIVDKILANYYNRKCK